MSENPLVILLAAGILVFVAVGITPPAKKIGTTPHPLRLLFSLSLCAFMIALSLYLPSPLKGFIFVIFTMMLWTEITHFIFKIPYDQFSLMGVVVVVIWLVVVVPLTYLLDPVAANTMVSAYKTMWGWCVQLAARIIEVAGK